MEIDFKDIDFPVVQRVVPRAFEYIETLPIEEVHHFCKGGALTVHLVDKTFNSYVTIPARINLESGEFTISAAYCQYLWSLCYVALALVDCDIIESAEESDCLTIDNLKMLCSIVNSSKEMYPMLEYMIKIQEVKKSSYEYFKLAEELRMYGLDEDGGESVNGISIDDVYAHKVNGLFTRAFAFTLLHEYSHYELQHLKSGKSKQNELNADRNAILKLSLNMMRQEQRTSIYGVVCALCALFFMTASWGVVVQPIQMLLKGYLLCLM